MNTDHYVPDPEAETTAIIDGFFDHLRAQGVNANTLAAVRTRHAELLATNQHLVVDEPARYNVRITLVLVAAYELLRPNLGRDGAIAAVEAALVEPIGGYVEEVTRTMLDNAPDPFAAMVDVARRRETESFGAGFEFRHTADDGARFHTDVHRCHYHDVLAHNGAPELTSALCAFDRNWINAIVPERHGFRFDRVTTIGTGGTHCPFHFTRVR